MSFIADAIKGVTNIIRRPGDIINNPMSVIGPALSTASGLAGLGAISPLNGTLSNLANLGSGGLAGGGGGMPGGGIAGPTGAGGGNDPLAAMRQALASYLMNNGGPMNLFKPVGDDGFGGKQEAAAKSGADILTGLGNRGTSLLDTAQPMIPAMLNQYATAMGMGGTGSNPYSLDTNQQNQLNEKLGAQATEEQQSIEQVKAAMAQAGITRGPVLDAAIRRVQDSTKKGMNSTRNAAGEEARAMRERGAQTQLGNASSVFGQGAGLVSQSAQGQGALAGNYSDLAGKASARNLNSQNNLLDLLGTTLGSQGGYGGYQMPANLAASNGGGGYNPAGIPLGPSAPVQQPNGNPFDPSAGPGTDTPYAGGYDLPATQTISATRAAAPTGPGQIGRATVKQPSMPWLKASMGRARKPLLAAA